MKVFVKILLALWMGASCWFTTFSAENIDPMNLPKLTQYVEDFSHVLSVADLESLRATARAYEEKTTNQMVVVLFPNREGNELFDIGMRIFQENRIGQAGKNNGILLLIATDEKKVRIITGYGLEGDIPDVLASDMIEGDIRPLVNNEKFGEATRAFFNRVEGAIGTDEGKKLQDRADSEGVVITSIMALIFGLIFSFNIFFLGFALFFFTIASFSIGSFYPILLFLLGSAIMSFVWLHYFTEAFIKNFFKIPKNRGWPGWGGGWWGGGGGWFSGGGGSSGGGGAGD